MRSIDTNLFDFRFQKSTYILSVKRGNVSLDGHDFQVAFLYASPFSQTHKLQPLYTVTTNTSELGEIVTYILKCEKVNLYAPQT